MANHRLANSIAKKLKHLDQQIDKRIKLWMQGKGDFNTDDLEAKTLKLLRNAAKELNIVRVGVADGCAYYYEIKRTKTQVTFLWFYGGSDNYIDDWGTTITIPLNKALMLILKPKDI